MSEFVRQTTPKLQSAKHWLDRAEKDFAANSPIRGELDLLLAEAELKACKEVRRPFGWVFRWTVVRHVAAVMIALLLVGAGGVYWSARNQGPSELITTVIPTTTAVEAITPPAIQPVIAAVTINHTSQEVNSESKASRNDSAMSPEEKQQLIRRATQSLRGQPK